MNEIRLLGTIKSKVTIVNDVTLILNVDDEIILIKLDQHNLRSDSTDVDFISSGSIVLLEGKLVKDDKSGGVKPFITRVRRF